MGRGLARIPRKAPRMPASTPLDTASSMAALWLLGLVAAALANGGAENESKIRGEAAHFKGDAWKVLMF